jgi:hypothetical protein
MMATTPAEKREISKIQILDKLSEKKKGNLISSIKITKYPYSININTFKV